MRVFIVLMITLILVGVVGAANVPAAKPTDPDWYGHLDVIVPGVVYTLKLLISTVVGLAGALAGLIWWGVRRFIRSHNRVEAKIDLLHHVMLGCDGCKKSMTTYGRREEDLKPADYNSD